MSTCHRGGIAYAGIVGGESGLPRGLLGIHELGNLCADGAGKAARVADTESDGEMESVPGKGGALKEGVDALPRRVELNVTRKHSRHRPKRGGEGLQYARVAVLPTR